jgi:hypothetical protein
LGLKKRGEVDEGEGHAWVLGAKGFFSNPERPLIQRAGFGIGALGFKKQGEVVEGVAHIRVLGTQGFFSNR